MTRVADSIDIDGLIPCYVFEAKSVSKQPAETPFWIRSRADVWIPIRAFNAKCQNPSEGQTDRQTGRWADKQRRPGKKETDTLLAETQKVQKWGFKGGAETTIEVNGQVVKVRRKPDNSIPTTSSGHPSSLTPSADRCLCRSCYIIKLIPICWYTIKRTRKYMQISTRTVSEGCIRNLYLLHRSVAVVIK